jgi:hypothetical protein
LWLVINLTWWAIMLFERHIILLGHKMYRGKDTIAQCLISNSKYKWKRAAFADALKDHVQRLYSLSYEQMYTELKSDIDPRYGITPRKMLQDFGQEQRIRDPNIWTRIVCEGMSKDVGNYIITDFRFPNEVQYIKQYFKDTPTLINVVKVIRPSLECQKTPGCDNISETALDGFLDWDYTISNDGTIDDLTKKVKHMEYSLQYSALLECYKSQPY